MHRGLCSFFVSVVAVFVAAIAPSTGIGASLKLWHKLDETSGTAATDASGNSNHGVYTGGPTLGYAAPRRLGAYFAANGHYVTAPASATLNALGVSNADFSVAFWVKPNGTTGDWRPLLHKGSINFERGPGLWLNPGNNRVHFRVSTTASNNAGTDSVANLPNGTWSHIACVKAANKWRCYINGVLDTEFTLSAGTTGNSGPLYVGDDPWYAGSKAWIDDVRLYSGALTDAEVKNLYGLVGYWKLNETTGTAAADSSNTANAGTYTNGPLLNQPGIKNTAVSFDATDDYISIPDSASLKATDSVTMAAWIRPTASTNTNRIIVNKEGEYELSITASNEIKWAFANTSPGWAGHQTGKFAPSDTWSHVVVAYDGVEAKTYLNGELVETYAANGNIGDAYSALNELRIGSRSNSPSGMYFAGSIDEVYAYTRAINYAEVANLYGLSGHWKFAEGSGTTAADSSGLSNAATLSGGATWTTDCAGNHNALLTNGTGGIAQTAASFTLPSEGTVAFWMRGSGPLSSLGRLCGVNGNWEIRQATDGKLMFDLGGSPFVGNEPFSTLDPVATDGKWYHIAAVFSDVDNSYSVYIDGALRTSGISPVDLVPQLAGTLSFGTRTGSTEYWKGALRDFRIYSRRLLPAEIATLHGLVGHWKLDEITGTTAADATLAAYNATYQNSPVLGLTGKVGQAVQFNGTNYAITNQTFSPPATGTVVYWMRRAGAPMGRERFFGLGGNWEIWQDPDGFIRCDLGGDGFVGGFQSLTSMVTPNKWYHIAATFDADADTFAIYIDGVLDKSGSMTLTPQTPAQLSLAARTGLAIERFLGTLDDLRIYNRVLCPTEIQSLHNSGTTPGVKIVKWIEIQ